MKQDKRRKRWTVPQTTRIRLDGKRRSMYRRLSVGLTGRVPAGWMPSLISAAMYARSRPDQLKVLVGTMHRMMSKSGFFEGFDPRQYGVPWDVLHEVRNVPEYFAWFATEFANHLALQRDRRHHAPKEARPVPEEGALCTLARRYFITVRTETIREHVAYVWRRDTQAREIGFVSTILGIIRSDNFFARLPYAKYGFSRVPDGFRLSDEKAFAGHIASELISTFRPLPQ